jgi:hypothetical protein
MSGGGDAGGGAPGGGGETGGGGGAGGNAGGGACGGASPGGVAPGVGGGDAGRSTGITHPERSKNMNSSAFSCGESSVRAEQQSVAPPNDAAGLATTGSPGNPVEAESLTCRAV